HGAHKGRNNRIEGGHWPTRRQQKGVCRPGPDQYDLSAPSLSPHRHILSPRHVGRLRTVSPAMMPNWLHETRPLNLLQLHMNILAVPCLMWLRQQVDIRAISVFDYFLSF